jgi:hypothetical protein
MRKKHLLVAVLCLSILLFGLERLYSFTNGGFRLFKLISRVPPEEDRFNPEEIQLADSLLNQSFRFLSSGGTSFVFLGEDGKTILKLFKHQHLTGQHVLFQVHFPLPIECWRIRKILERERRHQHKRQAFFFRSCALAHQYLKEETGLIFLCLKPNVHFDKSIRLIDSWGICHQLNLSQTEFALQRKAELLFPTLEQLNPNELKTAIDALLALIRSRCELGIGDRDPNLLINFGFIEGKAVEFDLGSYFYKPDLQTPAGLTKELFFSTYALQKWLEQRSPELLTYLLNCISSLPPNSL